MLCSQCPTPSSQQAGGALGEAHLYSCMTICRFVPASSLRPARGRTAALSGALQRRARHLPSFVPAPAHTRPCGGGVCPHSQLDVLHAQHLAGHGIVLHELQPRDDHLHPLPQPLHFVLEGAGVGVELDERSPGVVVSCEGKDAALCVSNGAAPAAAMRGGAGDDGVLTTTNFLPSKSNWANFGIMPFKLVIPFIKAIISC